MNFVDLFPSSGKVQRIYCDNCTSHLDLSFKDFKEDISGVRIEVKGLPVLLCPACSATCLPDQSRIALIELYHRTVKGGSKFARVSRNKTVVDFGFTRVPFQYDSDDYYYLPGLIREFDKGFLTPVFFNKEVLIKYDIHPSYRVSFASTTYGEIRQGDDFSIPFGINRFGKLVMWLGDIAKLPEKEQHYLKSENIQSDHSIGSEFYDAHIECKFTDRTPEDQLFEQRSCFLEACFKCFGEKIAHLEKEVLNLAIAVRRPIVDTPMERHNVTDSLNKIYIESFDGKVLEKLLLARGKEAAKLGSLKRLQMLLESVNPLTNIVSIISPFYVLYDLRVAYSHLGSDSSHQEKLDSVRKRLDLMTDADFFAIYDKLILELGKAFSKIAKVFECD